MRMYVCMYALGMAKEAMVGRTTRQPRKLWDDAKALAEQNDETISDVIRRALTDYVEQNS